MSAAGGRRRPVEGKAAAAFEQTLDRLEAMLPHLHEHEFDAPQGKIRVDASNNHTLCHSYVGKAAADGISYEIVKDFGTIAPVTPYCKL